MISSSKKPQFSIRSLLQITTAFAVISWIVSSFDITTSDIVESVTILLAGNQSGRVFSTGQAAMLGLAMGVALVVVLASLPIIRMVRGDSDD